MALVLTRADSIREYLTGASSEGQVQDDPGLSIGNFCSAHEAYVHNLHIEAASRGVVIEMASGANPQGKGFLEALDSIRLQWQAPGSILPGEAVEFSEEETLIRIVEGFDPSQFVRVRGTPPFDLGVCRIDLDIMIENVFGFNIVPNADVAAGSTQYRATIIRNKSNSDVANFKRWIKELGTSRTSDTGQLGGSGSGTIATSGSLADWPLTGWCQVRQSGGTLREVVYYNDRTQTTLTVPSAGRGLQGTSAVAGASTDTIHAVPGVAIGFDPAGVQTFGSAITTIANQNTAPGSVSWNLGISNSTGLSLVRLPPGRQIGIWIRRHVPAGVLFASNVYNRFESSFTV